MNAAMVEEIANAVLYEGYLLYPYRRSAIKNQRRWNFGVVGPSESMQTECLFQTAAGSTLRVRVRFLHLIGDQAMPRDVELMYGVGSESYSHHFEFAPLEDQEGIQGRIETHIEQFKVRVTIFNTTPLEGLKRSFISTHTILSLEEGEFISLLETPDEFREQAAACKNIGTWPVLVGEEDARDAMLSSPIILYDYPRIAPESAGALFDGTEIDEILTLRIMTLTDQEKLEMASTDARAKEILDRTESMPPEQFMKLHGVLRGTR
jgi:hypothetical protein